MSKRMKSYLLLLINSIIFLGLTGCISYHEKDRAYGNLEYRKLYKRDPISHSGSGIVRQKICSLTQRKCWRIERLNPSPLRQKAPYLEVTTENGRNSFILSTKTGEEVNCHRCLAEGVTNHPWSFPFGWARKWSHSGMRVLMQSMPYNETELNRDNYEYYFIDLTGAQPKRKRLYPKGGHNKTYIFADEIRFSPDENAIAWFACDPTCTLHQYTIDTAQYRETKTPCTLKQRLDWRWEDGIAKPAMHWAVRGASAEKRVKFGVCVDENNELLYPVNLEK